MDEVNEKRRKAGEGYWAKDVEIPAASNAGNQPALDYLERMRSKATPSASADFDADGDIDKIDAKHEKKIHELGFEGTIDHDKQGRPILSAMSSDVNASSTSIQVSGGYADYMQEIQSGHDGHEGIGH
jgi:hypothetical protein